MADFQVSLGPAIVELAKTNTGEIVGAFQRSLDCSQCEVTWGEVTPWSIEYANNIPANAGLAITLQVGEQSAALLISEVGSLLPGWYAQPDPTGTSKLTTLAQELGMLLLPDEFMPMDFKAERIADLRSGVLAAAPTNESGVFAFAFQVNGQSTPAWLIWPVQQSAALYKVEAATPVITATAQAKPESTAHITANKPTTAPSASPTAHAPTSRIISYEQLPKYTRSLLRISVPVRVTLAEKRQPLSSILELGPGSIIQFDKSCEDMLDLSVENQLVARGEAVKVGDKFGIRITSMTLPEERFLTVKTTLGEQK